jgi:hypothetical protein
VQPELRHLTLGEWERQRLVALDHDADASEEEEGNGSPRCGAPLADFTHFLSTKRLVSDAPHRTGLYSAAALVYWLTHC